VILGPAAILVFFPSAVYDNYGRFLSWGTIVLAPLCAVQLVDYFVLRRRQLSVRDLFLPADQSRYGYWKGVNVVPFVAIAAGAVTYSLLLNPVTSEPSGLFRYTTASLPAFVVAGLVHYVLTRVIVQPRAQLRRARVARPASGATAERRALKPVGGKCRGLVHHPRLDVGDVGPHVPPTFGADRVVGHAQVDGLAA
jgi:cytosine/uracil/thiamine/allantoin permease